MDIVNLQIQKYSGQQISKAVKIVTDHHLYHSSGWDMLPTVKHMGQVKDDGDVVIIATLNGEPIGCSLFTNNYYHGDRWAMCFVISKFRKKGIGQRLVSALGIGEDFNYGAGIDGSLDFWSKMEDRLLINNNHLTQHVDEFSGTTILLRGELK